VAEGVSLKLLIATAWHPVPDQMSGGETWTTSEPWTVQATAEGITVPSWAPPFLPEIIAARVQSLVTERFALKVHHETRDLAVYRLSIGKAGSRLNVTQSSERSQADSSANPVRTIDRGGRPQDVIPAPGRAMAEESGRRRSRFQGEADQDSGGKPITYSGAKPISDSMLKAISNRPRVEW
jgi:uncharacterized protein (TIGR03435 family)